MTAAWIVFIKELVDALRDRRTLVNSLLIGPILAPLFFILILKLALARSVTAQDELTPVTVVNAAGAPILVQHLRENGLDVSLREGTEADKQAGLLGEQIDEAEMRWLEVHEALEALPVVD